jgi:hypothetical protein
MISEEALKQRLNNRVARHRQKAAEAHKAIDNVISMIEDRVTAAILGNPVQDDGDEAINSAFDEAVSAIEDMREFCVDSPKPNGFSEVKEVNVEVDEATCVHLLAVPGTVAIYGGEIDAQKLERLQESTGLGDRLVWYPNTSTGRLLASIRSGGVCCMVFLTSLMSHADFAPLIAVVRQSKIPVFNVRKPGINTILAALGELDDMLSNEVVTTDREDHPRIKGPYKRDPIASRWFDLLHDKTANITMGSKLSAMELLELAGMEPILGEGEKRRLTAVMHALGWKCTRRGNDPMYTKFASVPTVLSES